MRSEIKPPGFAIIGAAFSAVRHRVWTTPETDSNLALLLTKQWSWLIGAETTMNMVSNTAESVASLTVIQEIPWDHEEV